MCWSPKKGDTHKAVEVRVKAKKLLSRRRQSDYRMLCQTFDEGSNVSFLTATVVYNIHFGLQGGYGGGIKKKKHSQPEGLLLC